MQHFRAKGQYDVILSRGAMDYNFGYGELYSTLSGFYGNLKVGGIAVFTFEAVKDTFEEGELKIRTASNKNAKLVEVAIRHEVPNKLYYERNVVYLLYNGIKPLIMHDFGREALYSVGKIKELMSKAGFETHVYYDFTKTPWNRKLGHAKPVFIGIKK